ncbi:MAG TPA: PilZ domain-containing protein [Beijerinckiaceae bacterium]|nr:PilZ domain-containing protein [Beijerinckiaceae bacterium]
MAPAYFTTANLDLALTKVRDGCPTEYTGRHRDLFEFHRLLLITAGVTADLRMPERRRVSRRHCFLRAEVCVPGRLSVPCLIKDVSTDGAGLILGEPLPLPEEVDLHVWKKIAVPVVVRWRKALSLGVEFRVRQRRSDLALHI